MRVSLSKSELDSLLSSVDLKHLHPCTANCAGVAVGIGRVVHIDNYLMMFGIDNQFLHGAVELDGGVFDARGQIGDSREVLLNWKEFDLYVEDLQNAGEPVHTQEEVKEWELENLLRIEDSLEEYEYSETVAEKTADLLREELRNR